MKNRNLEVYVAYFSFLTIGMLRRITSYQHRCFSKNNQMCRLTIHLSKWLFWRKPIMDFFEITTVRKLESKLYRRISHSRIFPGTYVVLGLSKRNSTPIISLDRLNLLLDTANSFYLKNNVRLVYLPIVYNDSTTAPIEQTRTKTKLHTLQLASPCLSCYISRAVRALSFQATHESRIYFYKYFEQFYPIWFSRYVIVSTSIIVPIIVSIYKSKTNLDFVDLLPATLVFSLGLFVTLISLIFCIFLYHNYHFLQASALNHAPVFNQEILTSSSVFFVGDGVDPIEMTKKCSDHNSYLKLLWFFSFTLLPFGLTFVAAVFYGPLNVLSPIFGSLIKN